MSEPQETVEREPHDDITATALAAEGPSHLGAPPPAKLADDLVDDLVDAMAAAAGKAAPAPPAAGGIPLPDVRPAPRQHNDTVLDGAREVRDVLTDPDASTATELAVSPLFTAALVAAGLERFVANPIMGAPAGIADAAQHFAKAEAHLSRGEYRQAAACLHEADARIERAAMVLLDIASPGVPRHED